MFNISIKQPAPIQLPIIFDGSTEKPLSTYNPLNILPPSIMVLWEDKSGNTRVTSAGYIKKNDIHEVIKVLGEIRGAVEYINANYDTIFSDFAWNPTRQLVEYLDKGSNVETHDKLSSSGTPILTISGCIIHVWDIQYSPTQRRTEESTGVLNSKLVDASFRRVHCRFYDAGTHFTRNIRFGEEGMMLKSNTRFRFMPGAFWEDKLENSGYYTYNDLEWRSQFFEAMNKPINMMNSNDVIIHNEGKADGVHQVPLWRHETHHGKYDRVQFLLNDSNGNTIQDYVYSYYDQDAIVLSGGSMAITGGSGQIQEPNEGYINTSINGVYGWYNNNGTEYVWSPNYTDKLVAAIRVDNNYQRYIHVKYDDPMDKYYNFDTSIDTTSSDPETRYDDRVPILIAKDYIPEIDFILVPAIWRYQFWTLVTYMVAGISDIYYVNMWFYEYFDDRYPLFPYEYGTMGGSYLTDEVLTSLDEVYQQDIQSPRGITTGASIPDLGVEYKIQWSTAIQRMSAAIWGQTSGANAIGGENAMASMGEIKVPIYNSALGYTAHKRHYTKGQLLGILNIRYPNGQAVRKYIWAANAEKPGQVNILKARGQMWLDVIHYQPLLYDTRGKLAGQYSLVNDLLGNDTTGLGQQVANYYADLDLANSMINNPDG